MNILQTGPLVVVAGAFVAEHIFTNSPTDDVYGCLCLIIVVSGFSLACEDFVGRFDRSFPACGFRPRIVPQWLSELKGL